MKIVQVVGARPQFIKCLPVSNAVRGHNAGSKELLENVLIHTGQHYDYAMSQVFFNELGIEEPRYHLGVGSGSHGAQTGQILIKVEEVLAHERPDAVVVYGDTNSTIGAALAAAKLHIPVAHVEAGLRSRNKAMPEEVNRVLTDHISTLLFCPSKAAVENLRSEGFRDVMMEGELTGRGELTAVDFREAGGKKDHKTDMSHPLVCNVGDVMYDVLKFAAGIAGEKSDILKTLGLTPGEYSVLTVHRAENTDGEGKLAEIADFVNRAAVGSSVVFPVHPRTRKLLEGFSQGQRLFADNVILVSPLGYFDMLWLLKNSRLVLTDSGGLQKEAYWFKVPCITLREETEWVETVQGGWNVLYKDYAGGGGPALDLSRAGAAITSYGDGEAAGRIVSALVEIFGKENF